MHRDAWGDICKMTELNYCTRTSNSYICNTLMYDIIVTAIYSHVIVVLLSLSNLRLHYVPIKFYDTKEHT